MTSETIQKIRDFAIPAVRAAGPLPVFVSADDITIHTFSTGTVHISRSTQFVSPSGVSHWESTTLATLGGTRDTAAGRIAVWIDEVAA